MKRDARVGLVVGLAFIVVFAAILSFRVTAQVPPHARLPVWETCDLRLPASTAERVVDPLMARDGLTRGVTFTWTDTAPAPAGEERLPAPRRGQADSGETAPAVPLAAGWVATVGPRVRLTDERPTPLRAPVRTAGESPRREPSEPVAPPAPRARTYRVRSGDTLTVIARRVYGPEGGDRWHDLYEANRDRIRNPDCLAVGQELVLPARPAAAGPTAAGEVATGTAVVEERPGERRVSAEELALMLGVGDELAEAPAAVPAMVTVGEGDTFYKIARRVYGDDHLGRLLYLRNKHLVPDARKLRVGQRILLLDGVERDATTIQVAMR